MADWTLEIIKREAEDPDPDLSYLGEYFWDAQSLVTAKSPHAGVPAAYDRDLVIDRFPEDDEFSYQREARYFLAYVPLDEVNPKTGKPYTRRTKQRWARRQYERMEDYNNDQWACVGLYVEAIVTSEGGERLFSTRSGGLFNVENDSGSDYYESIWADEMAEITKLLVEINEVKLTPDQIADAIKYADYR